MYVATINVPGYLPMDDDPPTFETAQEAWRYLWDERNEAIGNVYDGEADPDGDPWSEDSCLDELSKRAAEEWMVADFERVGTVYGSTPGGAMHDLGLAYCVTVAED